MRILNGKAHRWFDNSAGNTYFAARLVDVETDETLAHIPYAYGYGDQYQYEIIDAAIKAGKLPAREHYPTSGGSEAIWQYLERINVKVIWNVTDGLKRDLKRI